MDVNRSSHHLFILPSFSGLIMKRELLRNQSGLYAGIWLLILLLTPSVVLAATLRGTIYNLELEPEPNVLISINTQPEQKLLATEGTYIFVLNSGKYVLTAKKGTLEVEEEVDISQEGDYTIDIFLIPDTADEEDLWNETQQELVEEEPGGLKWQYAVALLIILWALWRYQKVRRRYGPLRLFRKKIKEESKKTIEQHKEELAKEPGSIDKALEIIKKHDGRISQKELRKEMLYLSEAKISLILTELEHKGKIEKVKKGRGNVVILRS